MYARKENNKVKKYNQLPKVWEKENGQIISNFRSASQEVYNEQGFYDVETPVYNSKNQKLGEVEIFEDERIARYIIIDKSTKEKEEEDDREEDGKVNNDKSLGLDFYNKTKRKLRRKHKKGNLTDNQFNKIYTPIRKGLIWVNTGDFDIALEEITKLSYTNTKLQGIIDKLIEDLNGYIQEVSQKRIK